MANEAPFDRYRGVVKSDWIDYNGHMNVAYYLLAFDYATDVFFDDVGLDEAQRDRCGGTTFAAEVHIRYHRELMSGDPIRVTTQLLSFDAKRLRYLHHMYHAVDGYLAATSENLSLYVDLNIRRVAAMPEAVLQKLEEVLRAHRVLGLPEGAGRAIETPRISEA
jgi:acyl-CoA thioester hydrolase